MRDLDRLSVKIGAQIKDFDPEIYFDRQKLALYDRVTQLTLMASREAMGQSGLEITDELSESTGVVLGTAAGGMNTWDDNFVLCMKTAKIGSILSSFPNS
jgi:nodulation protein E